MSPSFLSSRTRTPRPSCFPLVSYVGIGEVFQVSRSPTDPEQVNETNNEFNLIPLCSNGRRLIVALSPIVILVSFVYRNRTVFYFSATFPPNDGI